MHLYNTTVHEIQATSIFATGITVFQLTNTCCIVAADFIVLYENVDGGNNASGYCD